MSSGIKFGDIDLGDTVLQNEYMTRLLYKILDKILEKNKDRISSLTEEELKELRSQVVKDLQQQYPNMGIEPK